jgi:ATP adenylyltransferase
VRDKKKQHTAEGGCIFCNLIDGNEELENLIIASYKEIFITLNLYPYNPGHLMLFPQRHIEDLRDLTDEEALTIYKMTALSMDILTELYHPRGFNIGYNIGEYSGASISHLHKHIVPRFKNELGFLDLLSDTRIIVDEIKETRERLIKEYEKRLK